MSNWTQTTACFKITFFILHHLPGSIYSSLCTSNVTPKIGITVCKLAGSMQAATGGIILSCVQLLVWLPIWPFDQYLWAFCPCMTPIKLLPRCLSWQPSKRATCPYVLLSTPWSCSDRQRFSSCASSRGSEDQGHAFCYRLRKKDGISILFLVVSRCRIGLSDAGSAEGSISFLCICLWEGPKLGGAFWLNCRKCVSHVPRGK